MQSKRRVGSVGAPRFPATNEKPVERVPEGVPSGERTLRLLDYKYDEGRDIVLWKVEDLTPGTPEDRQVITLAYPSGDLIRQFGVHTSKRLPAEEILKFSEAIRNRPWPFTIAFYATARRADAEWFKKEGSPEELLKAHDELSSYPFREVQEIIAEEDEARRQ